MHFCANKGAQGPKLNALLPDKHSQETYTMHSCHDRGCTACMVYITSLPLHLKSRCLQFLLLMSLLTDGRSCIRQAVQCAHA